MAALLGWPQTDTLWHLCVVCGVWCVVCGVWCVVCGVWCVVCGVWCVVCGGAWCVVPGAWCVVRGVCDRVCEISSSLAVAPHCSEQRWRKLILHSNLLSYYLRICHKTKNKLKDFMADMINTKLSNILNVQKRFWFIVSFEDFAFIRYSNIINTFSFTCQGQCTAVRCCQM